MAALHLAFVTFKEGAYITVEGNQIADRFYIVRQGQVRIFKNASIVEEQGNGVRGPGDFFAVVATLSTHTHIETAQALSDVTLISVRKDQFGQLIQDNGPVALKIIREFSKRLRFLDNALSRLTLKAAGHEGGPDHLYTIGEFYLRQGLYNQAHLAFSRYLRHCPEGDHAAAARERAAKIAGRALPPPEFPPTEFRRTYPQDAVIFFEGEPGEELYVILEGAVRITKVRDDKEVMLALLKAGDIFGEMALLEAKPRTASATAYGECKVLVINRDNFERMIVDQPQMIARLTTMLAERIWLIYKQLANTLIHDPVGRLYDALLIQIEKNRGDPTAHRPFRFDFGVRDLANMVGLSSLEGGPVVRKQLEDKNLTEAEGRLRARDVAELKKQADYYLTMNRIKGPPKKKRR